MNGGFPSDPNDYNQLPIGIWSEGVHWHPGAKVQNECFNLNEFVYFLLMFIWSGHHGRQFTTASSDMDGLLRERNYWEDVNYNTSLLLLCAKKFVLSNEQKNAVQFWDFRKKGKQTQRPQKMRTNSLNEWHVAGVYGSGCENKRGNRENNKQPLGILMEADAKKQYPAIGWWMDVASPCRVITHSDSCWWDSVKHGKGQSSAQIVIPLIKSRKHVSSVQRA